MEIKWYQLVFQLINFGVLIWALNRFLYGPILKIIDQRNKKIEDSLKAAEANLKEKEKISQLKAQAVAEAEKEAVLILEKARQSAQKTGKQILAEAQAEAETAVEKKLTLIKESIAQEEEKLKSRMGELIITASRQLLQNSIGQADQRRILDRQIKQLQEIK